MTMVSGDGIASKDSEESQSDPKTVPLYHEARRPEFQMPSLHANKWDMERFLGQNDRLEQIAEDLIHHFLGRGFLGKALVVCLNDALADRTFALLKEQRTRVLDSLRSRLPTLPHEAQMEREERLVFLAETSIARLSSSPEDDSLRRRFSDAEDNLRLLVLRSEEIVQIDSATCATLYWDAPFRELDLRTVTACLDRGVPGKTHGLIVDYAGVFREFQPDFPLAPKSELIRSLERTLAEATRFCIGVGISLPMLLASQGVAQGKRMDDAVETLLTSEETRQTFFRHAEALASAYRAILPDALADHYCPTTALLTTLAQKIHILMHDIRLSDLLDEPEVAGYDLPPTLPACNSVLSAHDQDTLLSRFEAGRRRTEAQKLQTALSRRLEDLSANDPNTASLRNQWQDFKRDYASGRISVEAYFQHLIDFAIRIPREEH